MYRTEEQLERAKVLYSYLYPYWAKPSAEVRKFVSSNFPKGVMSCMIKGDRKSLREIAVTLLTMWGYVEWTNYTSETLLKNAFSFQEKGIELSDTNSRFVIIYHPNGTQKNSYVEEAISHNFTYRDISNLPTVVLSECDLPYVESVVKSSGKAVLQYGKSSKSKARHVEKTEEIESDPVGAEEDLGNVGEVRVETRGPNKGKLKVVFKGGAVIKYTSPYNSDKIKVGKPFPAGVSFI